MVIFPDDQVAQRVQYRFESAFVACVHYNQLHNNIYIAFERYDTEVFLERVSVFRLETGNSLEVWNINNIAETGNTLEV